MAEQPEFGTFRVYLLLLPDPIPVPTGSTWTRELDLPAPELQGVMVAPTQHTAPRESDGYNFVSLKFWQVPEPGTHQFDAVKWVLDEMLGNDSQVQTSKPTDTRPITPYQTVVEAVTYLRASDEDESEEDSDDLTRCIEVLLSYHRAYRIATQARVPELTYERLHPISMRLERSPFDHTPPEVMGITLLNHLNLPGISPDTLTEPDHHRLAHVAARATANDPYMLYMDRRLDAALEVEIRCRPGESIVQTAIAAEILLDSILGLTMWENSLAGRESIADAARVFSKDLMPRINNEYHPRLGGTWALTGQNLSAWHLDIATVRGRVVHGGYRPTPAEAADARDALVTLERFIGDQLAKKFKSYPRTAWLFLGEEGLVRRSRLRAANEWTKTLPEPLSASLLDWLRLYTQWREQVNAQVRRRQRQSQASG